MTRDLTIHTIVANWITPDACRCDVTCDPWIKHVAFLRTLQHGDAIGIMILLLGVFGVRRWLTLLTGLTS